MLKSLSKTSAMPRFFTPSPCKRGRLLGICKRWMGDGGLTEREEEGSSRIRVDLAPHVSEEENDADKAAKAKGY